MPRWLIRRTKPDEPPPAEGDEESSTLQVRPHAIDSATYDAVFRDRIESINRICFEVLRDEDEAKDATSAVLEKLLTQLPKTEIEHFDAWLRTVAKNTSYNHLRSLHRHRYDPLEEGETVEDPSPTPEDLVLNDELRRHLSHLVSLLTPDQRQVVILRQERFSSKEIGELLGRNVSWVDTVYHRAMKKLKLLLTDLDNRERGGSS